MKALSLIQPWATLIAIGSKRIETRSWSTDYRGPIAIHASKWMTPDRKYVSRDIEAYLSTCYREPFTTELTMGGIAKITDLPSGAIVATARLVDVVRTDRVRHGLGELEREFGDYRPGRYAWLLADVQQLRPPVPYRGFPGLWELPADVLTVQTSALPKGT